jgi:hypothetical protein
MKKAGAFPPARRLTPGGYHFSTHFAAAYPLAGDVMQYQGGNDHVERGIREGQLPGVAILHLDAVRNSFQPDAEDS